MSAADRSAMLIIARRELLERVRSRVFLAMTVLTPLLMVGMILLISVLTARGTGAKVDIVDRTGAVGQPLAELLTAAQWKPTVVDPATTDDAEMAKIRAKQITGYVTVPADGLDGGKLEYRGENGSSQLVELTLRESLRRVIQVARGKRAQLTEAQLASLLQPIEFHSLHTTGTGKATSGTASFLIGYILAYLVLLVIATYGVAVMRSVVQEKTSRVMELMVATVKPRALMTGKILGVGSAGLIQVAIWLTMGALTLAYRAQILGWFGASGGGSGLPELSVDQIALALTYFVLGFFFYASIYAALGAMVSSDQEAQQLQTPVTLVVAGGLALVTAVSGDPHGTAAMVATLLPLWSPMLMPMRYLMGGASLAEVALSLGILVVSTVLVARAAARIYRVGILMYGKRPSLRELIHWLRY